MRQCLLAAACQNMKKIARLLAAFLRLYGLPEALIEAMWTEHGAFADVNGPCSKDLLV